MSTPVPPTPTDLFEKALRGILRPLVRALIAKGVTAPALYRILKQTYVDVSTDTLGEDATDSRISVATGVHRRDVKEMRELRDKGAADARRKVSTLSTVVGRWLGSDDTTDAQGGPIPLPRSSKIGPNFEALVQSVSRDVRPRTILDELIRQNIATLDGDTVTLSLDALVGPADFDQRVHFFAHNLGDHMNAAVENLLDETPQHLERAVFYNHLSKDAISEIETNARTLSNDLLLTINKQARTLQDRDVQEGTGTQRFRFGVFFYQENEDDAEEGNNPQ